MSDDKAQFLNDVLTRNLAWVAAADSKVAPTLALDTAMLGVLAALLPGAAEWLVLPAIISALAALGLLSSLAFLIAATFPRLSGPDRSLVYFGGIKRLMADDYVKAVLDATPDTLIEDVAAQCHRNAEIADVKFRFVRNAMILLYASIPLWLVAVAWLYALR